MIMLLCGMSIFILSYREDNSISYSYRTFYARLGMYGLYVVFGLYKHEEENVACRQAAIFISLVQILHSLYVLVFTVIEEPFRKFVEL